MTDYVQRALMALGTVFANRLVNSRVRSLPALAAPLYLPEIPTIQVALGLSSSIAFLYYQLRNGNMVNVSSIVSNSRPQSSWFIRNLNLYRRRCASAVKRILAPNDSLELLRSETRTRSVNTFDSAQELRLRDSRNRRTIKRRGRSRRRRRPILGVTRVRRADIGRLCGADTSLELRPRSEQATETTLPIEVKRKFLKNKAQQVAGITIPIGAGGGIARKTRSGKIYGCS